MKKSKTDPDGLFTYRIELNQDLHPEHPLAIEISLDKEYEGPSRREIYLTVETDRNRLRTRISHASLVRLRDWLDGLLRSRGFQAAYREQSSLRALKGTFEAIDARLDQ